MLNNIIDNEISVLNFDLLTDGKGSRYAQYLLFQTSKLTMIRFSLSFAQKCCYK